MRVLVTGSRKWKNEGLVWAALDVLYEAWLEDVQDSLGDEFIVVQGEAPGLDTMAKRWAVDKHREDPRVDHEDHPAHWDLLGKAAGHIRNKEMVDLGASLCLAFPTPESIGTLDCMKLVEQANIPLFDMSEYL